MTKTKKILGIVLAVMILTLAMSVSIFATNTESTVLPDGVDESSFGDNNTVTDGTNYYATLSAAVTAIDNAKTSGAILYCKPNANVGVMAHAPVCSTLTVYGNGATVATGGNQDFDIGNTDPNGGNDVTGDMTLTVYNLNGCGAWGTKATEHTVNLVFVGCKDMGEVFLNGTVGTLNITLTDCSFTSNVVSDCKVYSNANGEIILNGVEFSNVDKAVNCNHKVAGIQTVTLSKCTFTDCGNDVTAGTDEIPVRILSSVEGGESVLTVSGCTFSGTPEGGADILLDYAVGTTTASISTTSADVVLETENNVGTTTEVSAEETKSFTNAVITYVAEVNGQKFESVLDALTYAIENSEAEVKILANAREVMPTDVELLLNADLTITADAPVEIKFYNNGTSYDFVINSANSNDPKTLTIGENVSFILEDRVIWLGFYGNDVDVVVNGTLSGYQLWVGADLTVNATGTAITSGEALVMRRGATLTVDGGKVDANYFNILAGNIDAKNGATIDSGAFWIANTGNYIYEGAVEISIKDSTLTSSGNFKSSTDASVNVTIDNSTVEFTNFDGYSASEVDANTTLTIKNASDVAFNDVTNNGTIVVSENVTLSTTNELTNIKADVANKDVVYNKENNEYVFVDRPAAKIGETKYATLKEAFAALEEGDTLTILAGEYSEGTIKLLDTLKNVTIQGEDGAILKDMGIYAADGNVINYVNLTFDNITFDNSNIVITGNRNTTEIVENLTVTKCVFKNIENTGNLAALHLNMSKSAPLNGLTFTSNVIDGISGSSNSGIYATAITGKIVVSDNTINNVALRPFILILQNNDGVADELVVTGNTFSGSPSGRAQALGAGSDGTDTVSINVNNNIFKGITNDYQICFYNFNSETTTTDLSGNYYDVDIVANPGKIYYNTTAGSVDDLKDMGIFPIYKALNADGTINEDSAFTPAAIVAQVGETKYATLAEAVEYLKANGGTLVLLADAYESMTFNTEDKTPISETIEITIDLNGFIVTSTKSTLWVSDGYIVTVKDSVGTGKIVSTNANGEAIAIARSGKVILESGYVYNEKYAVYLYSGSATGNEAFIVNGGVIEVPNGGTAITIGSGTVTVNGGKVLCNKVPNGGGWNSYIYQNCTMIINDGEFLGTIGNYGTIAIKGGTFSYCDDPNDGFRQEHLASGYGTKTNDDGSITVYKLPACAKIGDVEYNTIEAAIAAAVAGDEIVLLADAYIAEGTDVLVPGGVTLNGNGYSIYASGADHNTTTNYGYVVADGDLTIKGITKIEKFTVSANKPTITIGEGACLEIVGVGRLVIGHGATFNITGSIVDAKTANTADLTPSLIMPGASFTGAGVTFNVTNAYIKTTASYCSSSSSASGTFTFNINNSIWEQFGKLAFEAQSTAATVNFYLNDSVLTTTSHLVFGVSAGEVVIDNSNVNVGTSRQLENRSNMTIKNGSVVNGAVATSSNAINPGTITVENATYAVTGEFSGSGEGVGTIIIKSGANFSAGSVTKANITIDATDMTAGEVAFTANLAKFEGELTVINNDKLEANIVDGKIVLSNKPVAQIGETKYATLAEAFANANGGTVVLLDDITIDTETITIDDGVSVKLDMNGKTITVVDNKASNVCYELFYIYGELTVTGNGTIKLTSNSNDTAWAKSSSIFHNRGGVLTIENGTFEHLGGTCMAFVVDNSGNYYGDATTNIKDGELTSTYIAIRNRMEQNSHGASGKAILNVEGGKISGTSRAIWAQAASTSLTAPATGAINISGGEIGLIDTARSEGAVSMTIISGGTVSAFKGEVGELTVTGGTLDNVTILTASGEAADYVINANGTYVLAVAKIGDVKYATLAEAIAAAQAGDTIVLIDNVTLTEALTILEGTEVTLDLAGKKITTVNDSINVIIKGKLTIDDTVGGGISTVRNHMVYGELVLTNGTLTNIETATGGFPINLFGGSVTINGGSVKAINQGNYAIACNAASKLTINAGTIEANWGCVNVSYGTEVEINGGTFNVTGTKGGHCVYVSEGTATINGGTFNPYPTIYSYAVCLNGENANVTITGGTFGAGAGGDICVLTGTLTVTGGTFAVAPTKYVPKTGYAIIKSFKDMYVVGEKPTATVNNLGSTVVPSGTYSSWADNKFTQNVVGDMPLSFVMQFLADQNADDMANSPYADWYGDFVITFTGIEEGSFVADGCYLAGYYGDFGWIKIPVDGMVIEEGARYPVMLGVGLGQSYDYICSSVKDFRCALYIDPAILADNPNLQVNLELSVIDSSEGEEEAAKGLASTESEYIYEVADKAYTAEEFKIYVAQIGENKYLTLEEAIAAAQAGDTITILESITLTEGYVIDESITIDLNGKTIALKNSDEQVNCMFNIVGNDINVAITNGKLTVEYGQVIYAGKTGADDGAASSNPTISLDGVTLTGADYGITVAGNSIVNIKAGTVITGAVEAVRVFDYAKATIVKDATVTCTTEGKYAVLAYGNATVVISGGTFNGEVNKTQNASIEITGGSFSVSPAGLVGENYAIIKSFKNMYIVGEKPTATVNNLGSTVVLGGTYGSYDTVTGKFNTNNPDDMPLSFVMQFLADQNADDMANSPYADWYGDFVITFTGIEEGSFVADGCYLAGYYGDFGWIKIPVDGMVIEEGARYPVMLGVGLGQSYDYICSSVKDFRCALYIDPAILADNPNLKVNLELSVIDNSEGEEKAADGLTSKESEYIYKVADKPYTAEEFVVTYVAQIGDHKFTTFKDAIDYANENGGTVTLLDDIELDAPIVVTGTVTLDLAGYTINYNSTVQGEAMITNKGNLTINDSVGTGEIYYNYTGAADSSYGKGNYTISNAGTLTVNGGKIAIANLSGHAKYPIDNNSTTGDAILVINGGHLYNYNTSAIRQFCNSTVYKNSVTINGGLIEGYSAIWVQNPGSNTVNGDLTVNGGEIKSTAKAYVNGSAELKDVSSKIYFSISGDGGAWSEGSFVALKGGIFNENVKLSNDAPATYTVDNASATFNGRLELPVASVNGVGYATLAEAIANANGGTVTLLENVELTETIKITGTVTLDLNGKKLVGPDVPATSSYYAFVVDGGDLTIKDTVGNGEIWAKCYGVETKSGSFTMESGTITATNNKTLGSAIVNYGGTVTIKGGTMSGTLSGVYTGGYFSNASTNILGGTINGPVVVEDWADKDFTESVTSASNTYSVSDDYEWVEENGVYVLVAKTYVAQVGDVKYTTLAEAIAYANENGGIVTLLENVELTETIKITGTVTLNLNGKTITGTDNTTKSFSLITNNGTLTIKDSVGEGKITLVATNDNGYSRYSSVISNTVGGKLIVEGGTIEHLGGHTMAYAIDNLTNGDGTYAETEINGGLIKSTYVAIRQFLNGANAQNILTVKAGTIDGANTSIFFQSPSTKVNSGTLVVKPEATLTKRVYIGLEDNTADWDVEISIAADAFVDGLETKITHDTLPIGYEIEEANGIIGVVNKQLFRPGYTFVNLGNDLSIEFNYAETNFDFVNKTYYAVLKKCHTQGCLCDPETYYVAITKNDVDANGWVHVVANGIAAKEMICDIEITIYEGTYAIAEDGTVTTDGVVISETNKESVVSYVKRAIEYYDVGGAGEIKDVESRKKLFKTLADMLVYGAEAQKYFGHYVSLDTGLATYGFEAFVQEYATDTDPTITKDWTKEEAEGTSYFWGANIDLEHTIFFNLYFVNVDLTKKIDAEISFTHKSGAVHNYSISEGTLNWSDNGGFLQINIDDLTPADLRSDVECKLYDENGAQISYVKLSVEDYIAIVSGMDPDNEVLYNAIMKYADSSSSWLYPQN